MDKLHEAAIKGDLASVQKAVVGADAIDIQESERGNTPLMLAAYYGRVPVVDWLVSAGADLEVRCHEQNTALMKAAGAGAAECVERLLQAGADVNAIEAHGMSA